MKRSQNCLLRSKNLDLFLLAGCSCLLTLIYHPVAEAFSGSGAIAKGTTAATTAIVETEPHRSNAIQLTLPERKLDPSQDAEVEQS